MANHASAKKRIRQTQTRKSVNGSRLSRVRTYVKKVEQAILNDDKAAANEALVNVAPILMRGAQKGVMHRNTASRKLSRLAARVKAL